MSGGTVAELVKGLHNEAGRALVDVVGRYADQVRKAATGKLSPDEAATAASIAYELGLPPERFDRDVAIVQAERKLAAVIEADGAAKTQTLARGEEYRERITALEKEIRELRAASQRISGEAMMRTNRKIDHAKMQSEHPHLFKSADTLSDAEWKAVRS